MPKQVGPAEALNHAMYSGAKRRKVELEVGRERYLTLVPETTAAFGR